MMPLRARVWSLGKFLVLIGALVSTFLVFATVAMRVTVRAREVRVPVIVGRSVTEATQVLADAGLGLRVDTIRRPDETIPAGGIIHQEPAADTQVRRQRTIRVWLSSGRRTTSVPAVVGESARAAEIRIVQEGLEVGPMTEFRSADYGPDAVVAQDPLPSSRAPRVSLLVNRGDRAVAYVMPDLVGANGVEAAEALRVLGLRTATITPVFYPDVPAGTVVRQQPAAGFPVGAVDPVAFEVSGPSEFDIDQPLSFDAGEAVPFEVTEPVPSTMSP